MYAGWKTVQLARAARRQGWINLYRESQFIDLETRTGRWRLLAHGTQTVNGCVPVGADHEMIAAVIREVDYLSQRRHAGAGGFLPGFVFAFSWRLPRCPGTVFPITCPLLHRPEREPVGALLPGFTVRGDLSWWWRVALRAGDRGSWRRITPASNTVSVLRFAPPGPRVPR
jgi:hypothetical protein